MNSSGQPRSNYGSMSSQKKQSRGSMALPNQSSSASFNYSHPHHTIAEKAMNLREKRGEVKETSIDFAIVVDVHDFNPEEISVQIVDNASAAILRGQHGKIQNNKNDELNGLMLQTGEVHSESRMFSERYTLPPDLNMGTFRWDFPDKNHLRIMADKLRSDQPTTNPQTIHQAMQYKQLQEQQMSKLQQQPHYYPHAFSNPIMRFYGNNNQIPNRNIQIQNPNNYMRNGCQRYGYNIGNPPRHQHIYRTEFPY